MTFRNLVRVLSAAGAIGAFVGAAPATASTSASVSYAAHLLKQPLGAPWDLGLTVTSTFTTPDGKPPAALSSIRIKFPKAKVNDSAFPACNTKEFLRAGPKKCPTASRIGTGLAMVDARPLLEHVHADLAMFTGPKVSGGRQLLLFATTREVQAGIPMTGVLRKASGRYGYDLTLDVPPIHVLDTVRDPSIESFEITVKAYGKGKRSFIQAPTSCPSGGLPFQSTVSYYGGEAPVTASAVIPCVLRSEPGR